MPKKPSWSFTISMLFSKCYMRMCVYSLVIDADFSNNTKQFCDILAKHCGWRVVMPDFFYGDNAACYFENGFDREGLIAWIGQKGTLEIVSLFFIFLQRL